MLRAVLARLDVNLDRSHVDVFIIALISNGFIRFTSEDDLTAWSVLPVIVILAIDVEFFGIRNHLSSLFTAHMVLDGAIFGFEDDKSGVKRDANIVALHGVREGVLWFLNPPESGAQ